MFDGRETIRAPSSAHRRAVVLSVGAIALTPLSGCLEGTDPGSDGDDDSDDAAREASSDEVETIDATGSTAGTVAVPAAERIQLVNFTRRLCPTSEGLLTEIDDARAELAESESIEADETVDTLSVIDGDSDERPTEEELAEWWDDHDGDWPIGFDDDGSLSDALEIAVRPTTVVLDDAGTVHWRTEGDTSASNLVSAVETALEGSSDGGDGDGET
ncbi:TlpA family protein disulfide reductase [Natronorubrum sediminis]|uniref:TlpA family protein disulfide reductase n=1 Tax=Natronorubrum sediminis TaxID=640943 RepID=UPI0011154802|nr:TlpA family protein disulfide reductase [Natronorubrum sediminis]